MKHSKRNTAHEVRATLTERIDRARANYYHILRDGLIWDEHHDGCPFLSSGQPCLIVGANEVSVTGEHCRVHVKGYAYASEESAWHESIETAAMVDALARAIESHTAIIPSDDKRNALRERLAIDWPFDWHEPRTVLGDVTRLLDALASHETYSPFGVYGSPLPSARPWLANVAPEALARAIEDAAPNDDKTRALAMLLRAGIVERTAEGFPAWKTSEAPIAEHLQAAIETTLQTLDPLVCIARALASIESNARGRITIPTNAHATTVLHTISGQRSTLGANILTLHDDFVHLEYRGNVSRGQMSLRLPEPLPRDLNASSAQALQWALSRLMHREHASAFHDFVALITSTDDVWTWEVHRERTPWGERVRAGSITDRDALAQVCERVRRWEAAKIWIERKDRKTGQWGSVAMHDRPLIWIKAIDGRASHNATFRRAIIRVNEALFSTNDGGTRAVKPHFATLPRDVLSAPHLDPYEIRLAFFILGAMRALFDTTMGVVRLSSKTLADYAALPECKATELDERLRVALTSVEKKGAIGAFSFASGHWTIRPSQLQKEQWFYPTALPHVDRPVAMLGSGSDNPSEKTSGIPSTGDELRAWRGAQGKNGITQNEVAQRLGVGLRTIIRAEQRGRDALSRAMIRAITNAGATITAGKR